MTRDIISTPSAPRVVIIGGGFGGLACAAELGSCDIDVLLLDRRNHNLFQPLLYQVATAALSPADIAEPIRRTLSRFKNIKVLLAEVDGVDQQQRIVTAANGETFPYDHLVIATGSDYNYFGRDDWRALAPGLKTLREAREIRQRLLLAFEQAELSKSHEEKLACLTTIIIGGGPTGVEMAGAISELGRFMITKDYRNLAPDQMRVVLVEAGPRILAAFPEELSTYAEQYLKEIGVEVQTGTMVTDIRPGEVVIGSDIVLCGCVVWGAGIKASPAARWLGIEADRLGRIPVNSALQVEGCDDIYSVRDTSLLAGGDGKPLPALAQVAKQQGQHLGQGLRQRLLHGRPLKPFIFRNRGNTAVIGRNAAVFDFGSWRLKGRLAWLLWAFVHVYLLINFEKRVLVSIQWVSRYITRQRGARIVDEEKSPPMELIPVKPKA